MPFEKGDPVRVTEGAFENCQGVVEKIDSMKSSVRIAIRIFDQMKRVTLGPGQLKKR